MPSFQCKCKFFVDIFCNELGVTLPILFFFRTDSLIQKSIRTNFEKCTVITIAHRLNTIMDSDRVLVMDAGQAVEFDHPHILLQNPDGFFTRMVKQTGSSSEAVLTKKARESYERKFEKKIIVEGDVENKTNSCNGK